MEKKSRSGSESLSRDGWGRVHKEETGLRGESGESTRRLRQGRVRGHTAGRWLPAPACGGFLLLASVFLVSLCSSATLQCTVRLTRLPTEKMRPWRRTQVSYPWFFIFSFILLWVSLTWVLSPLNKIKLLGPHGRKHGFLIMITSPKVLSANAAQGRRLSDLS